ncbi:MAG: SDR family NAD(P)-dependent oxidoreductase [Promethearchaeota archaeon]
MKDFKNKVAVITGAASGIGKGLAKVCFNKGMKISLADIDEKGLRRTERLLKKKGAEVISVLTNVSKPKDMELLAKKTLDEFGEVHLLFNNAGIGLPGLTWEYTVEDWEMVLGVNLWGVILGIQIFVPIMLKQNNDCYIVNTSSIEGLISSGIGGATYGVSKHGLICLSERLALELEQQEAKIKVSVLCPGFVSTNIFLTGISRLDDPSQFMDDSGLELKRELLSQFLEASPPQSPDEVAEITFQAIQDEKFYIFTHKQPVIKDIIKERFDNILKEFD